MHGGVDGELAVGERLRTAEKDANPQSRRLLALVIGRIASPHFCRPLETLLTDADTSVLSAALQAAGNVGAPQFWPSILAGFAVPGIDRHAIAAAHAVGEPILREALDLFGREDTSYLVRRAIIILSGRIGNSEAVLWLLGLVEHPDRRLKIQALNALWLNRHKADAAHYPMLRRSLKTEAEEAARLLGAWKTLAPANDAVRLLRSSLEAEVEGAIHNLFCLMALLLQGVDIREARINYTKGGPVRRAYVIEMFDNVLDSEMQSLLLPLLEAESTEERALHAIVGIGGTMDAVQNLAKEREGCLRGWTQACALRAMAGGTYSEEELGPALRAEEKSVRETAQWLLAGPSEFGGGRNMLIIEKVLILRSVSIFAEVSEQYLNHLAASAKEVELTAGQALFEKGDFGTALYVILQGRLRVHVGDFTIAELGDLQVVGEMAALDPEPRSASVSAIEDSLLLRITSDDLDLLLSDDVAVARSIIRVLCQRLRLSTAALPRKEAPAAA
jgi:HEAT repeat protein